MTIFLGCGSAAKYPEGGGNFSVPLQWMLGLRRLGLDAIWLELLPSTGNACTDEARVRNFQRRLQEHGLRGQYCLLQQTRADDLHDLDLCTEHIRHRDAPGQLAKTFEVSKRGRNRA